MECLIISIKYPPPTADRQSPSPGAFLNFAFERRHARFPAMDRLVISTTVFFLILSLQHLNNPFLFAAAVRAADVRSICAVRKEYKKDS